MEEKNKSTFKRLALVEVQDIFVMNSNGKSIRQISRATRRSPSTVHRVLTGYMPLSARVWLAMNVWERARHVYMALKEASQGGGNHGRLRDSAVRDYVLTKLVEEHWSPEEIAARMLKDMPGSSISAKTIYNFLKHERADLKKYLMEKGKPRRQRITHRRGRIKQGAAKKRSIHDRPEIVAKRKEPGHWEVDLIVSKKGGSGAVLSLTERVSRKKIFQLIPDTCAKTVFGYLWGILENLPPKIRKSFTLDNGSEFAYFQLIRLEQLYPGL
jgi:IS30 family transposase